MILVVSTFRVVNGMEGDVAEAFRQRPRLVESAAGFLGIEVLTSHDDPATFHLMTRWTDAEAYRTWHRSHAHHESHALIPRGLKLDPKATQIRLLDPVGAGDTISLPVLDLMARLAAGGSSVHVVRVDAALTVVDANETMARALGLPRSQLVGRSLEPHLSRSAAAWLRAELAAEPCEAPRPFNLVGAGGLGVSLRALVRRDGGGLVLVAEPEPAGERALRDELLRVNARLTVLIEENARKTAELERAHRELDASRCPACAHVIHEE